MLGTRRTYQMIVIKYMNKIWAIILRIRLINITSSGFNEVFLLVVSASEVAMIGLVMFKRNISRANSRAETQFSTEF